MNLKDLTARKSDSIEVKNQTTVRMSLTGKP
jgi:hypothetical protein